MSEYPLTKYLDIIKKITTKPELGLLHDSVNTILLINKELNENKEIHKFKSYSTKGYNEIILFTKKGKEYAKLSEGHWNSFEWVFSRDVAKYTKLSEAINSIIDAVKKKEKSKIAHMYKNISHFEKIEAYLFTFLNLTIINGQQSQYQYKYTNLSITLSQAILNFLYSRTSLRNVKKLFDKQQMVKMDEGEKAALRNLVISLFKSPIKENKELKALLRKEGITHPSLQDFVLENLIYILIDEHSKNTIYDITTKQAIGEIIKENTKRTIYNKITKVHVSFGQYFLDGLVEYGIFTLSEDLKKDEIKKLAKNRQPSKVLLVDPNVLQELHKKTTIEKAFLLEMHHEKYEELRNEITMDNKLIHENMRIELTMKDKCYIHDTTLSSKFAIDVNYLAIFLDRLYNGLSEDEYLSLFNINKDLIEKMRDPYNENSILNALIKFIFDKTFNFAEIITSVQLTKLLDAHVEWWFNQLKYGINQQVQEVTKLEYKLNLPKRLIDIRNNYNEYRPMLNTIINKICPQRSFLITMLQQAISYSNFKYIIFPSFLDSRGRVYLSAVSLNIFTNPIAKSFVKLYDENQGHKLTEDVLLIIKNELKFKQTQSQIQSFIKDREYNVQHITEIHQYIQSYLTISMDNLLILIDNPTFDDDNVLLDALKSIIKKQKRLFYVHSLIIYERLRKHNLHDKHLCNYIQKDASSSGLQMMSIFFRNAELATISNLIGNENNDIYSKAASHCLLVHETMRTFARNALVWFGSEDILLDDKIPASLSFVSFENSNYEEIINKTSFLDYLKYLLTIDLESSPNVSLFLNFLKDKMIQHKTKNIGNKNLEGLEPVDCSDWQFLLPYLTIKQLTLIKNLVKDPLFKDHEKTLDFIFCFRYALRQIIMIDSYIDLNYDEDEHHGKWAARALTKHHVMTTLYMSTAFGRKEAYRDYLQDLYMLPKYFSAMVGDFASFLEKTTDNYLSNIEGLNLIFKFIDTVCQDKKILIENHNFIIKIEPRVTKDFQVSCSSFSGKRGPQLVIKTLSDKFDKQKLKTMFMANLAHSMDSDLMHYFVETCININEKLKSKPFSLIFERNHDCFILNHGPLLKILLEEAYLKVADQDNIEHFLNLDQRREFISLSRKEFIDLLNPINPNFIK